MNATLPPETIDDEPFRISSDALSVRWPVVAGLIASLLLHVLIGLVWMGFEPRDLSDDTQYVAIEMVQEAPPPPAPVPEPPKPPPPPPPPPPAPPAPPQPAPPPPAPAMPLAVQPVQRESAPYAPQSTAPRPLPRPSAPAAAPPAAPSVPRNPESRDGLLAPNPTPERPVPKSGSSAGRVNEGEVAAKAGDKLTQSEVDFLLAQVLRVWLIDYKSPRFKDIAFAITLELRPDGMLGPPFGAGDPWAPERMISNYAELQNPQARDVRTALESFLGALRQAQPFKRQPDAPPLTAPKFFTFAFSLGDL
jgi:hypothetical protein